MSNEQAHERLAELEKQALTAIRSIREWAQAHPDDSHACASSLTHINTIGTVEQRQAWRIASEHPARRVPVEIPW